MCLNIARCPVGYSKFSVPGPKIRGFSVTGFGLGANADLQRDIYGPQNRAHQSQNDTRAAQS